MTFPFQYTGSYGLTSLNRTTVVPFSDDSDLKAYFKFNESSGNIINVSEDTADLGSAADLIVTGATHSAGGVFDTAVSNDGINDTLVSGTSLSQYNFLHNQSFLFTISVWVKRASWDSSTDVIFSSAGELASADIGLGVRYSSTNGSLLVRMANGTNMNRYISTFTGLTQDSNYHHLVITGDVSDSTDTVEVWEDGSSLGTTAKSTSTFTNSNATDKLTLASTGKNASQWGAITFDECAIFNRRLSDAEIGELYNSGAGLEIY